MRQSIKRSTRKSSKSERQSKKKLKRQWRLMTKTSLVLVSFFILLAVGIEIGRSCWRAVWDGQRTFYLTVQQEETLWLVKLDKNQKEMIIGEIPPNLIVTGARGFGEQQAKNIYKLAEMEKSLDENLIKESMAWTFGLPIEGIIYLPKSVDKFNLKHVLIKKLFGMGETNLARWDLIRLLGFVQSLRFDQINTFSFSQAIGVYKEKRPDGVEILKFDPEQLDIWLSQNFTSRELVNESLSWEVINTTEHSGLAGQVARLLRNTGIQVTKISEGKAQTSGIFSKQKIDSKGLDFFSHFLQLPLKFEESGEFQSDVRVVLGENFWQRCCTL